MALQFTFRWGSDKFKSRYTHTLEDVSVDMMEMKVKYRFSNTSIGEEGGFYFDPIVAIKRDGERIATDSFHLGQDEETTRNVKVDLEKEGTFTPSIEIVGIEDLEFDEHPDDFDSVDDFWGDSPDRIEELTWPNDVTAEEPPDISELNIDSISAKPSGDNTIKVSFGLSNNIMSGDGEQIKDDMEITSNDDRVAKVEIDIPPRESVEKSLTITNLKPGEKSICIKKV